MNIGILTHPQGTNYGGILQCYALCTYLRKLGHNPIVIRREVKPQFFLIRWTRVILKALHYPRYYNSNEIDKSQKIRPFVEKHLTRTAPVRSARSMQRVCKEYGLEVVIVGSDQIWRHDFAMNYGYNYFLDFVPDDIIKFSYAASLGLPTWNYSCDETVRISALLKRFSGVSVREEEAVGLLQNNTHVNALQHVDPTMLLTQNDYQVITAPRLVKNPYIFVYWLGDKSIIQDKILQYSKTGYTIVDINLRDNTIFNSVEEWLSYIRYADLIVTDSFHGCVFSLLFERQFVMHSNSSGGNGRLISLFKGLGIESKLMEPEMTINYTTVNDILSRKREESITYIINNLKI